MGQMAAPSHAALLLLVLAAAGAAADDVGAPNPIRRAASMAQMLRKKAAQPLVALAPAPALALVPTTTDSPMTGNEDEDTKDEFIRQCTVTFLTSSPELLPVETLEAFCSKTDSAVECRLRVVEELKQARKTEDGVGLWCRDSFAWFQKKYGGKCPIRCEKLMCKASCKWLKIKAELDDKSEKADEIEAAADGVKNKLQNQTDHVRDLKASAQKAARELTKAETEKTFQEGEVLDASAKLKTATTASQKSNDDAALWKKKLEMAEAEVKRIDLALRDVSGKEQLAQQKLDIANKDVASQTAVVDEVKKMMKDGKTSKAALDLDLKTKKEKLAAAEKVVQDELEPKIAKLKQKAEHWKGMVAKAEKEVKWVNEGKDPEKARAAAEDLLKQQRQREQDALDAVAKAELEKTRATTDIKLQKKAIEMATNKVDKAAKAILTLETENKKQTDALAELQGTATAAKTKHEALMKNKASEYSAMEAAKKALEKAKDTLKFVTDSQATNKAAVEAATVTEKGAKASLDLARAALKNAQQESAKATEAHKAGSESLKKSKQVLDGELGKLAADKQVIQKELNQHLRVQPEIIAQHDLGL